MTHRVLVIQNEKVDPVAQVGEWIEEFGIELDVRRPYAGEEVPAELPENVHGLIVMGGAMGANDDSDYAWLSATRGLLRDAALKDLPTFGICLGAQVLATAVGGTVTRADVIEIGPVEFTVDPHTTTADPLFSRYAGDTVVAAQWHQDWVATLPDTAVVLAGSNDCPVQAFRVGENVYGVQFHPELDAAMFKDWASDLQDEAGQRSGIDMAQQIQAMIDTEAELADLWRPVLHSWAELVKHYS
jgi:GMP synthase (glutamine-hydrolysing)